MRGSVNPYQQYRTNQVDTADPKALIIMLYDGAIRFLDTALENIDRFQKYDEVNRNILRAQDIITELMLSLDMEKGGEIAANLFNLYSFMKKELLEGNVKKNADHLLVVKKMLSDLKSAWEQIDAAAARKESSQPAATGEYKPFAAQG